MLAINATTETEGSLTRHLVAIPLPDGTTLDICVDVTEGRTPDTLDIAVSRGWEKLVDKRINLR